MIPGNEFNPVSIVLRSTSVKQTAGDDRPGVHGRIGGVPVR